MIEGINVYWYSAPYSNKFSYFRRILAFFSYAFAARKKACKVGGDIVFATSTPLTIAIPGVYASKHLKIPLIFEVRDLWPELPVALGAIKNPIVIRLAKYLERYAYRNSQHIVALSPGMAEGVIKTGYSAAKVSVIPNNCAVEIFRSPTINMPDVFVRHPFLKDKKVVLYAGTLGALNGVSYLAEVAHRMRDLDSSIVFVIIGDGAELNLVKRRAAELDVLEKNLWLLPRVSKNEMPAYFSAATIGCSLFINLPEMRHNSANKFFDTLAAGKPVAINYLGWQAEKILDSGAGIVLSPTDFLEAAADLKSFINDSSRMSQALTAAKALSSNEYNTDVLFAQLSELFESLVADTPRFK